MPELKMPMDARSARGMGMARKILEWLPLDGTPIRSEEIFEKAAQNGVARTTVLRHLREAEDRLMVLRYSRIVGGRPAVFYGLASENLLPFPKGSLQEILGLEGEWSDLFARGRPNFRTRKDLEWFLRSQTCLLVVALQEILARAPDAPSRQGARLLTEIAVDHIIRRWLEAISEVMWVRQGYSRQSLVRAMQPLLAVVDRHVSTLEPSGDSSVPESKRT